ncbi:MAG: tRNA 2-thiouridine(34) synthase MnmA [Eubacteriales bacterium]|nr:tRNA 2-thiouridine(34) synthase MnmA [Eubacteriales bacterium]
MKKKAMIAMSGGVDSSAAAWLMKRDGYDCMGVTMRLFAGGDSCSKRGGTCCSLEDIEDARSVARQLGIPYFVFNFTEDFSGKVMDRFVCAYENGFTPNPCIDCNRYMKFEKLLQRARALEYDYVVTGHYARIEERNGLFVLKKGVDESKDQSYVLYSLDQEQLAHMKFPLGGMKKTQIRAMAEEAGLVNARKKDSQDICFVPDGNYAGFIERYTGRSFPPGNFVDLDGRVMGQHKGIIHYTVGQRKGLGLALKEPAYVCRICPEDNTVVLGRDSDLWSRELTASGFRWSSGEAPRESLRIKAKIRYRHREQWATAEATGPDSIHLVFDEPQRAITRGQSVVLYDEDTVVGGGMIDGLCGSGPGMESGV